VGVWECHGQSGDTNTVSSGPAITYQTRTRASTKAANGDRAWSGSLTMTSRSIDEALARIRVQVELTQIRQEVQIAEGQVSQVSLPGVNQGRKLAPHVALRTALFAAMADRRKKGGAREFVRDQQIAGLSNMRVRFTGQLLDQQDLDVLLAVLDTARGQPLGGVVVAPARRLLLAQRKGDDGRSYAELEASLKRLAGAVLDIDQGGARFIGSLLSSAKRPCAGDAWSLRIDPDLVKLFAPGGFASLHSEVRADLHGKPLAKWLHGYYSSQPEAHALRIETVKWLSGSQTKDLRSFKQTLVRSLRSVTKARRDHGQDFFWEIDAAGLLKVRQ